MKAPVEEEKAEGKAKLYIVGTPIGNLSDITLRALEILKNADWIVCEDTRTTAKLLQRHAVQTPLKSYRLHRQKSDIAWVCKKLAIGSSLVLTSDAGTPSISDPGAELVRTVRQNDLASIVPIPGPSALTAALSVCGWQSNPCLFTGFLSPRQGRRVRFLKELASFTGVLVIYESVHRLKKTIHGIKEIFPDRDIMIAREMTKYYEEFVIVEADQAQDWEKRLNDMVLKGEFTIVVGPYRKRR